MAEVQQPPPPVAAAAAPAEPKTSVADVVPNDAGKTLSPLELMQQQQALLLSEKERNKQLADRLERLEKAANEREQADKLKRKREEDEQEARAKAEFDNKRSKFVATARTQFEEIEKNGGGSLDKAHLQHVREQLIGSAEKARSEAELKTIGEQFGPLLALTHAASASAKQQREENEKREMRRIQSTLVQMVAETPSTPIAVSGGLPSSAPLEMAPPVPLDTGTVRASRFNIFGDLGGDSMLANRGVGATPSRTVVSEVVATPRSATTPAAAPVKKEVDLTAPDAIAQVIDDYIETTGYYPSEAALRAGGVQKVVTVVASADGAQRQQIEYAPRLQQPLAGPLTMKHVDPPGFKQLVDGINEAMRIGGKRPDGIVAAMRLGEKNDTGKFVHLAPYRGPIAEDRLLSQGVY